MSELSISLSQKLAWYKIRDMLFEENDTEQDVKTALQLADVCEHPDAVWLTKLFAGRNVSNKDELQHVFLECKDDRRAVCFAGINVCWYDTESLRRAANLGTN